MNNIASVVMHQDALCPMRQFISFLIPAQKYKKDMDMSVFFSATWLQTYFLLYKDALLVASRRASACNEKGIWNG
jgi:hypothetical protein